MKAVLDFNLPAEQERFDMAIQGHKWRKLVITLNQRVSFGRDCEQNQDKQEVYRNLLHTLRDEMATLGLTLADPKFVKAGEGRVRKYYEREYAKWIEKLQKEDAALAGPKKLTCKK